jgi:hypothetical protein
MPTGKFAGRARHRSTSGRRTHDQARDATMAAVTALREAGLSERDTGALLGISHQRVHQLGPTE